MYADFADFWPYDPFCETCWCPEGLGMCELCCSFAAQVEEFLRDTAPPSEDE